MTYAEWESKGQYNSDKAHAAWDYAGEQVMERMLEILEYHFYGPLSSYKQGFREALEHIKKEFEMSPNGSKEKK